MRARRTRCNSAGASVHATSRLLKMLRCFFLCVVITPFDSCEVCRRRYIKPLSLALSLRLRLSDHHDDDSDATTTFFSFLNFHYSRPPPPLQTALEYPRERSLFVSAVRAAYCAPLHYTLNRFDSFARPWVPRRRRRHYR
mgnify:CR=1 FL=1